MQLKLDYLNKNAKNSYRSERLLVQLEFLVNLYGENRHPQMLSEAIDKVYNEFRDCGSLTNEFCVAAESSLMTLSHDCKTIEVLFAAHAHIDMNWMWGYNETAAVTIDTFRTMLDLMKEYPDFTFSQSQASVYKIVEELDSEMLREI
ncbi:MAG: alpha-mannosidase, partial [Clostridiales bacterium]|nr:alpha-mannosidase [Clostridiales bacterium]